MKTHSHPTLKNPRNQAAARACGMIRCVGYRAANSAPGGFINLSVLGDKPMRFRMLPVRATAHNPRFAISPLAVRLDGAA